MQPLSQKRRTGKQAVGSVTYFLELSIQYVIRLQLWCRTTYGGQLYLNLYVKTARTASDSTTSLRWDNSQSIDMENSQEVHYCSRQTNFWNDASLHAIYEYFQSYVNRSRSSMKEYSWTTLSPTTSHFMIVVIHSLSDLSILGCLNNHEHSI